jgi:hypothetical protein
MTDFSRNREAVRGIESGNVAEFADESGRNSNCVREGNATNEAA